MFLGGPLPMRAPSNSYHVSAHTHSVSGTPILSPDIPQHPGVVPTPQGSSNISLHRDHPASSPVFNPGICQRPVGFSQCADSRHVGRRHGGCGLRSLTDLQLSFFSFLWQYASFLLDSLDIIYPQKVAKPVQRGSMTLGQCLHLL